MQSGSLAAINWPLGEPARVLLMVVGLIVDSSSGTSCWTIRGIGSVLHCQRQNRFLPSDTACYVAMKLVVERSSADLACHIPDPDNSILGTDGQEAEV